MADETLITDSGTRGRFAGSKDLPAHTFEQGRRMGVRALVPVVAVLAGLVAGCGSAGRAAGHADDVLPPPGAGVGDDLPRGPAGGAAQQEAARISADHSDVVNNARRAGCEVYFAYNLLTAEDQEAVIEEVAGKLRGDRTTAQKLVWFAYDLQNSESSIDAAEVTAATLLCNGRRAG